MTQNIVDLINAIISIFFDRMLIMLLLRVFYNSQFSFAYLLFFDSSMFLVLYYHFIKYLEEVLKSYSIIVNLFLIEFLWIFSYVLILFYKMYKHVRSVFILDELTTFSLWMTNFIHGYIPSQKSTLSDINSFILITESLV